MTIRQVSAYLPPDSSLLAMWNLTDSFCQPATIPVHWNAIKLERKRLKLSENFANFGTDMTCDACFLGSEKLSGAFAILLGGHKPRAESSHKSKKDKGRPVTWNEICSGHLPTDLNFWNLT